MMVRVFDARYFAFLTVAALLVLSPGATMAVVLQVAVTRGRAAALAAVAGVNLGNSTLALLSALGMAAVFARWPSALDGLRAAGAAYLAFLGGRGVWRAWARQPTVAGVGSGGAVPGDAPPAPSIDGASRGTAEAFGLGIVTNLLNPSVIVFYMTLLPQFISARDPFLPRFFVLAATHVAMALAWLTCYALFVGRFAERLSRPGVRRALETVTGVVLIGFGLRLALR